VRRADRPLLLLVRRRRHHPPDEPEPILHARARLHEALEAAPLARPENDWIVGQEVRYLVEQGRADAAVETARACRGTPWWCSALAGFALHAALRFAQAESAFVRATGEMPGEIQCRWTDWSKLLDGDLHDR
jgi:hypothetical protein